MPSTISSASCSASSWCVILVSHVRSVNHETAVVLLTLTEGGEADPYTLRVQESQVVRPSVNDGTPHVFGRQGLVHRRIEHNGHIVALGEHLLNLIAVAFRPAKGEMIVSRQVAAIRVLRIVIELHAGKHIHNVPSALYFYSLPADVAGEIQTERRQELHPVGPAQGRLYFLYHIGKEQLTGLKESLRLADTGLLRPSELPVTGRIQTGDGAPSRRRGARLIAANRVRGEVKPERKVAKVQTLFQLRIAFGKHISGAG